MTQGTCAILVLLLLLTGSSRVGAQASPTASAAPSASAPPPRAPSCEEYLPKGATRPKVEERFPTNGTSGYGLRLELIITHGAGETVLPAGFSLKEDDMFFPALREAHFAVADFKGHAAPEIVRPQSKEGSTATTTVALYFVGLPPDPGRQPLVLPSVPISVSRANGQVMTLCTRPHTVVLEDPIANEPEPEVRPNPPPRPQREEWTMAKHVTQIALAAIALGLVLAFLISRWRARPRAVPEPPRELPWITAMRELAALRRSGMLDDESRFDELFDRVDHCTRRYLGDRYGFDGLESTTEEIRGFLSRVRPPVVDGDRIDRFLSDTDLVKYTDTSPRREDCADVLDRAELIVAKTIPAYASGPDEDAVAAPSSGRAA
ncbi:MAG: hypothetical protein AAF928_00290 [Myxococcota bacterium]